jgi:hypothetical protein
VTGIDNQPNYRIDHAGEPVRPIEVFDGKSHNPFTRTNTPNWSTRSTTFHELQQLIGRIRGFTPRPAKKDLGTASRRAT